MRLVRAAVCAAALGVGLGCGAEEGEDARAVPLRCEGAPVADRDRVVATGLWSPSVQVGPCGQMAVRDRDARTWLAAPGGGLELLGEGLRELSFSPSGDRLLYRTGAGLRARSLPGGAEVALAEGEATWGWLSLEGARVPVVCAGSEVRLPGEADGREPRVVARDAFSCVAFAQEAPVMVYRDLEGVLVRLDVGSGERRALPEVPYRSEGFSDADLARDDHVALSRDGLVLVYQERWRRFWGFETQAWAAVYDLRDGHEVGTFLVPKSADGVQPMAVPGSGHALVIPAADWMVVVTEGFALAGYEGWRVLSTLPEGRVLALEEADGSVHALEVTAEGVVSVAVVAEALVADPGRLAVSPRGFVATPRPEECVLETSLGYCRTVESVVRWRFGRALPLAARFFGQVTVHWISDDGQVLVEGTLDDGDREVPGVFLYGADGGRLVAWPGLHLREVRGTAGHLLVVLGDPGGGAHLQILEPATGRARTVASGDGGLTAQIDDRARTMIYSVGRRSTVAGRGFAVEWDLHAAPLALR